MSLKTQCNMPLNASEDTKFRYLVKYIEAVADELSADFENKLEESKLANQHASLTEQGQAMVRQILQPDSAQDDPNKLDVIDPVASGSFSLNRATESTVGRCSVTEGYNNVASGQCTHAEGYLTEARGNYTHTEGIGTIAASSYQHVFGTYNQEDTTNEFVEIVGNGITGQDGIERSNARALDWAGNEYLAGMLVVNGHELVATQNFVTDRIPPAPTIPGVYNLKIIVEKKKTIYKWVKEEK